MLEEGLDFGHRDLVLLRKLSEASVFLSYAALECWVEGEISRSVLESILASPTTIEEAVKGGELSWLEAEPGVYLVGIEGELEPTVSEGGTSALVHVSREESSSPLLTVYGGPELSAQLGMGGAWNEEELQQESVTLLDGESSKELVEAFRHLFRAAPSGAARASVVGAALSRHRPELNLEVAEKLEEISPPFGQAMRQLFEDSTEAGARALEFLLQTELEDKPPSWSGFWSQIRPSILGSLARTERGTDILIRCVDALGAVATGDQFLNHQLLDAFLQRLDELTPKQQERLVFFIVEWSTANAEAAEVLSSRLDLTSGQHQRLLLGECLRRHHAANEDTEALAELAELFVDEALSAGSTAGSLALADLLRNFGPLVLEKTSRDLTKLTERNTLNLIEVWELMLTHDPDYLEQVSKLYLDALSEPSDHLSLLLKSELLQNDQIFKAFSQWLSAADVKRRRQVVQAGYTWSLTVENRDRLAQALQKVDWDFAMSWSSEWGRPHLSFQRLGWLALCAPQSELSLSPEAKTQLSELLRLPRNHLYFWDLLRRIVGCEDFELSELASHSARASFEKLEAHQDEERDTLFAVGAECAAKKPSLMDDWAKIFRTGQAVDVWWLSGVAHALYTSEEDVPAPSRELISGIISRLISSGEKSMKDLLALALAAEDEEEKTPQQEFVPLEVSNLAYEALAAIAQHPACALASTIRRRLALFLLSWAEQLRLTEDTYAFRETPLFGILQDYLNHDEPQLQELLNEIAVVFLELHRKHPEKLRLEVRHRAQQFFLTWAELHPEKKEAASWKRVMEFD